MAEISRRRVLIGAAWTTPAVLVATSSPPAAASTLPEPPDIDVVITPQTDGSAHVDMDVSVTFPVDTEYVAPFSLALKFPEGRSATLQDVTFTPADGWEITPSDPNNLTGVTFTYVGPPQNPGTISIDAGFQNAFDPNGDEASRTILWTFAGDLASGESASNSGSVTLPGVNGSPA